MSTINNAQFRVSGANDYLDELTIGPEGLTIGRGGENDYVLRHREISRHHMRITWRSSDGRFLAEDLDSSNGSWLNERRMVPEVPVELNEGDVLRLGPFLMRLERVYTTTPAGEPGAIARPDIVIEERGMKRVRPVYLPGSSPEGSTWLQYLPAMYYENDQNSFFARFLLIFESIWNPVVWQIDNFEMYLSPDTAPAEWLQWMASWFDLLLVPELPVSRQRTIMRQIGWLFLRRSTPAGLSRLLELYFGVRPEIIENEPCHFEVRLPLSQRPSSEEAFDTALAEQIASQLIEAQRPAFASYRLDIV